MTRLLLEERESRGVLQVGVARRLGIDHAAVHRLERRPLDRIRPATLKRYRAAVDAELEAQRQAARELAALHLVKAELLLAEVAE